jgi:hypothetical protein
VLYIPASQFGVLPGMATQTVPQQPRRAAGAPAPAVADGTTETEALSPWDIVNQALTEDLADPDAPARPTTDGGATTAASTDGTGRRRKGAQRRTSEPPPAVGTFTVFQLHEELVNLLAPSAVVAAARACVQGVQDAVLAMCPAPHVSGDSLILVDLEAALTPVVEAVQGEGAASEASLARILADLVAQAEVNLHSAPATASSFGVAPEDPLFEAVQWVGDVWRERLAHDRSLVSLMHGDRLEVLGRALQEREATIQAVMDEAAVAWIEAWRAGEVCVCVCVSVLPALRAV